MLEAEMKLFVPGLDVYVVIEKARSNMYWAR